MLSIQHHCLRIITLLIVYLGHLEFLSQQILINNFLCLIRLINKQNDSLKGIVHFEIKIWYLSAYPKGIQDVGVFFSSVDPILMFLGQTVLVCQSYNGRYRSLSL